MTNTDLETIRRVISEVCAAYDEPDSPKALACAFYQLRRVRDYVLPRCNPSGRKGGQIGGRSRSPAKIATAKANGKKGGRRAKLIADSEARGAEVERLTYKIETARRLTATHAEKYPNTFAEHMKDWVKH